MTPPRVSVVIPAWKDREALSRCLWTLAAQTLQPGEIIVVENEAEGEAGLPGFPQVTHLPQAANLGFCRAVNRGIEASTGEWVLVLNQDVELDARYLEHLLAQAPAHPQAGLLGGALLDPDSRRLDSAGQTLTRALLPRDLERGAPVEWEGERPRLPPNRYVFSLCAAAALYRRSALEDLRVQGQWFEESLFAYYDDLDVAWRAHLRGWKAYYVGEAWGWHRRGALYASRRTILPWKFFEKPAWLKGRLLINPWAVALRNASGLTLALALPFLAGRTAALIFASLFDPQTLWHAWRYRPALKAALRARREIQGRRLAPDRAIQAWINV